MKARDGAGDLSAMLERIRVEREQALETLERCDAALAKARDLYDVLGLAFPEVGTPVPPGKRPGDGRATPDAPPPTSTHYGDKVRHFRGVVTLEWQSAKQIAARAKVARQYARTILQLMVRNGEVERDGEGRGNVRYRLKG